MNNDDNEEFMEMDNKSEEVSTRAKSEAEEQNQNNKNAIFITSMKVVTEEKPAEINPNGNGDKHDDADGNSFVERIKKR